MGCKPCIWSQISLTTVDSCPKTESEQKSRADLKNCESMARKQNCSDPQKFKYHCLPDELQSTFVEVCAPETTIVGFCTEYNTFGMVIQEKHNLNCSAVDPPCPHRYLSTDAYQYIGCYNVTNKQCRLNAFGSSYDTTSKMDNDQNLKFHAECDLHFLYMLIVLMNIATIAVLGAVIICKKRCIKQLLQSLQLIRREPEGEGSAPLNQTDQP